MSVIKKLYKALSCAVIISVMAVSFTATSYAATVDNMDYIVHCRGAGRR